MLAARSFVDDGQADVWSLDAWSALFASVDAALARQASGETTALVVVLGERGVVGVSVGDSEAWVIDQRGVDVLTEQQARKLRLGTGRARPTSFVRPRLEGTLVVGSDGLFAHTSEQQIVALVRGERALEVLGDALVALVRPPSGRLVDDVAIVCVSLSCV